MPKLWILYFEFINIVNSILGWKPAVISQYDKTRLVMVYISLFFSFNFDTLIIGLESVTVVVNFKIGKLQNRITTKSYAINDYD